MNIKTKLKQHAASVPWASTVSIPRPLPLSGMQMSFSVDVSIALPINDNQCVPISLS